MKTLSLALIALVWCFHTGSASAQTACASSVTIQWFYGSTCYAIQAEAVAAMQSDPANPQNATLTIMAGATMMSTGTTQYKYVAPSPISITNGITVYYGGRGPTFPTQAQALSYIINTINPPIFCGATTGTPSGAPVFSGDLGSPSFGPGYVQNYTENSWGYDIYSNPECGQLSGPADWQISYWMSMSCPMYYTLSGSQCIDNSVAYITSTVLTCQKPSTLVGDPCDAASGEFTQTESDYFAAGLTLTRYYHSATLEQFHGFGVGWTHNYSSRLIISGGAPVGLLRPDGHHDPLAYVSSASYVTLSGDGIHVLPPSTSGNSSSNYWAVLPDGSKEVYNTSGALIQLASPGGAITSVNYTGGLLSSVVEPFGHTLQFTITNGNITGVKDPAGNMIRYSYDGNGNLSTVVYQDSKTRTYQYTNAWYPNNLTGILDENNAQFLTVVYDSNGRASSSQNAGGANAVSMVFNSTSATVTDSLGGTRNFSFVVPTNYSPRPTSVAYNGLTTSYVVPPPSTDPQQRATQMTDPNGNISKYAYDTDHLTSKTEAYGTGRARTTSYQYLSTSSALPTQITEALRQTTIVYYPGTNTVHTKTITDTTVSPTVSRTWTYTYNSYGQVLTVDGPRTDVTDVTTYTYYTCTTGTQCGQIDTVTNALGQLTTYNTYNANGQPLTMTDPNGVVTTMTYDTRLRLKSRQVGTETTSYSYFPTGLLQIVTLPDSSTITYTYDGAHRLTDITDGLGNHTHYTLDAMGNHTAENTYDPSNALHRTHTRVINTLNQLYQDVNSAGTAAVTTTYAYDNNGNLTSSDAPLARNTANQYDELNRAKQVTDPNSGITTFAYDANDALTTVTDPRILNTIYINNGFGQVTKLASPDTGTTITAYDSGGNLKTTTDARGAVATYSYDALNRVTQQAYADQTIAFTYDAGTNGKGRLTGASDANHSLGWTYDALGRVTGKSQKLGATTKSVGYAYTNGDMTSMVTPSGQTITYGYTNHRITSLSINGSSLLSGVTYDPFGPTTGWTWGNSTAVTRSYDMDGNITQITSAADPINFGYDNAFRITGITDTATPANSWTIGYDIMDRVNSAAKTGLTVGWSYDANGNRTAQTGASATTFVPATTSNRLSSTSGAIVRIYAYDAAGNPTSYGTSTSVYNDRGRLSSNTVGSVSTAYVYNALGQMIEYTYGSTPTMLIYDESGHLLGEYYLSGVLMREFVWMGDIPVAELTLTGSILNVFYLHTDQLNAPRKISRPSDNALEWRWDPNPFGVGTPNQNPAGLGTFINNLRFPGQIFTYPSGLYQNGFRDYDSSTGGYVESDPIGLKGGLNTYVYAGSDPAQVIDSFGLFCTKDFVENYYSYKGTAIDLSSVSLLPAFQNAPSVVAAVNAFKGILQTRAKSEAARACAGNVGGTVSVAYNVSLKTTTDVTNVPCLFSVGHSTFFRRASCSLKAQCCSRTFSFSCNDRFGINDAFADPLDIGIEAGGKPYPITAVWNDSTNGSGTF